MVRHFVGASSLAPGKSISMVWPVGTTRDSSGRNGMAAPVAVWTSFFPVTIPQ